MIRAATAKMTCETILVLKCNYLGLDPMKYVKQWPCGIFVEALGHSLPTSTVFR